MVMSPHKDSMDMCMFGDSIRCHESCNVCGNESPQGLCSHVHVW